MIDSPETVICPACNAQPGERCTAPDSNSRHEVKWHHHARITAVSNPPKERTS